MIRGVAQQLAQAVAQALVRFVGGRHPVCLVDDDQIPVHLAQTWQNVGALGQVERRDHPIPLEPLVDAELLPKVLSLHDQERGVVLFLELTLPLEGEVRGADDEDPLGQAAQLQLADEEARHDRLAGAGVICEQEAHAR